MIDEELLDALRHALARRLSDGDDRGPDDGALRCALRGVSRSAHAQGLRAEQVVIALKRVWEGMPEVREAGSREARARMLERLVTLCIDEYYAEEEDA